MGGLILALYLRKYVHNEIFKTWPRVVLGWAPLRPETARYNIFDIVVAGFAGPKIPDCRSATHRAVLQGARATSPSPAKSQAYREMFRNAVADEQVTMQQILNDYSDKMIAWRDEMSLGFIIQPKTDSVTEMPGIMSRVMAVALNSAQSRDGMKGGADPDGKALLH